MITDCSGSKAPERTIPLVLLPSERIVGISVDTSGYNYSVNIHFMIVDLDCLAPELQQQQPQE
jgi:hypothetical protein